jgi:hypothetical protein
MGGYNTPMAVYLFTLHSYGSWLPDRARGYTRRGDGVLPADSHMAGYYRDAMRAEVVRFDKMVHRHMIKAVVEHCEMKSYLLYAVATDSTHAHILLGWHGFVRWADIRRGLKYSITRRLNERVARRQWFVRGGSRKQVKEKGHFNYLTGVYLPSHRGLKWSRE